LRPRDTDAGAGSKGNLTCAEPGLPGGFRPYLKIRRFINVIKMLFGEESSGKTAAGRINQLPVESKGVLNFCDIYYGECFFVV